ncbi:hypothetical protein RF11_09770 [Thelohanellus kitauei]|uniref:Uncharacterized protein n=1 Tax=Thelohanellus kitauei TaxID=669202 RepID=A0A0C2J6M1_THEKT|nr:hypothetical protein RF11_09770 [Thelohanellus kitauei]
MESSHGIKDQIQQSLKDEYINKSQSSDISTQMEAVKNIISNFSNNYDREIDNIFIKNFPSGLYDEFVRLSEAAANDELCREKQLLFFKVFIFIFRMEKSEIDSKTESIIKLFLNYLKIRDRGLAIDRLDLINSIKNCILNVENKILFIDENAMFQFYYCLRPQMTSLGDIFWKICQDIYGITLIYSSSLCLVKLTKNMEDIMSKLCTPEEEDCAKLLIMMFRMIKRLKLLNQIVLDVSKFFDFSVLIFSRQIENMPNSLFVIHLSKIWSKILRGTKNKFVIDNIEQVIYLSSIFCIDLSRKIMDILHGPDILELTKNQILRLFLIYLMLVAYPIIDRNQYMWINSVLKDLHTSFQKYLDKNSFNIHSRRTRNHILEYFMKSLITVNMEITQSDKEFYHKFFEKIFTNPRQISLSFLTCHCIYHFLNIHDIDQSVLQAGLDMVSEFLNELSGSLCNKVDIMWLEIDQKVKYTNDKNKPLLKISDDFINSVFGKCATYIRHEYHCSLPEIVTKNEDYKTYCENLALIVVAFNDSKYIEGDIFYNYESLLSQYLPNYSGRLSSHNFGNSDSTSNNDENSILNFSFPALARLLLLIYELKFTFKNIQKMFNTLFL